jgi:hypothetical protein
MHASGVLFRKPDLLSQHAGGVRTGRFISTVSKFDIEVARFSTDLLRPLCPYILISGLILR